ncbi:MAG: urease accessory protein UreF [Candidatus Acidiferrales bacterium]
MTTATSASMDTDALLSLLQFSDGLFPAGGYAHSFGLETYVQSGAVSEAADVEAFVRAYLENSAGPTDAVAAISAARAAAAGELTACLELDAALEAMKCAAELRDASRQMGRQTLRIAAALGDNAIVGDFFAAVTVGRTPGHHAVAFGLIASAQGWSAQATASALLYATSAQLVGAALRLMPLGQLAGQRILSNLRPVIARLAVEAAEHGAPDEIWSFVPAIEIAAMQHAQLSARLFRS